MVILQKWHKHRQNAAREAGAPTDCRKTLKRPSRQNLHAGRPGYAVRHYALHTDRTGGDNRKLRDKKPL
jgi:hypothetical protein